MEMEEKRDREFGKWEERQHSPAFPEYIYSVKEMGVEGKELWNEEMIWWEKDRSETKRGRIEDALYGQAEQQKMRKRAESQT